MLSSDIRQLRLQSQQLLHTGFQQPADIVSWMGAMQGQEFGNSKWAIGTRLPGITTSAVEAAIANRSVIRTWMLRGTLHLVAASDLHWMLALIRDGAKSKMRTVITQSGLDEATLKKVNKLFIKLLEGGQQLTRKALAAAIEAKGIDTSGQKMSHLLWQASFDGILCHGPLEGKQFTFTLLKDWIPAGETYSRAAALAKLALRYFTSHGPATVADFAWWSGFATGEANAALEAVKKDLVSLQLGAATYWMAPGNTLAPADTTLLLPAFDEYFIAYKDRSHSIDTQHIDKVMTVNGIFNPVIVFNGELAGTWKKTQNKAGITIELAPFKPLKKAQYKALEQAAATYAAFSEEKLAGLQTGQ
ncbi:winged helix DNA-binding domain-containing protein [Chitinophaga nivalis]|uniref:Winged helix DNA-binding domain-containing protein n=1 Tax=Chitinophaga nivalis TaxID=2991709 RepID=A0ABT3ISM3_9BACT|nr:winged helix DNA-binding domain-containing protein [Chitinophaga nivalis]MCW3463335.1 winged helix DNA-binding domain-containing protein [Chitinophaga nivalis]MCW3486975.1 winged helix DNA-binding domain-containing protein [Chitinophaga nivalis]